MNTVLNRIDQTEHYRIDYHNENKQPETMIINIRYGDSCGNGHNTFSITADTYETYRHPNEPKIKHPSGKTLWLSGCGCQHEKIRKRATQTISGNNWTLDIEQAIKFHLCSTDGPMHYLENTTYHVEHGRLDYARSCACWPDATDNELTEPYLKHRLLERLPKLMEEFRSMILSLGFTY